MLSAAKDFYVIPKNDGPRPALILLHDYWGLDAYTKHEVERYADQGRNLQDSVATGPC